MSEASHGGGQFPTTRWTLIGRLKAGDAGVVQQALGELCAQYHYPLYCVMRRRGLAHHDAQDALHDFLASFLRRGTFAQADAEKGRLRALLCTALQRFVINWRRDQLHRTREVSLELPAIATATDESRYRAEHFSADETPERTFDRKWGHELLQRVLRTVEEKYTARGRADLFTALCPVLLAGGSLRGEDTPRLAAALGRSEGAVRIALLRLLGDFRTALEAEVFQTVSTRAEVDEEIAYLQQLFTKA